MLHSVMPGTAEALAQGPLAAYIGIDPTAASLHVGSLATLMLLRHAARSGHRPVVVLGGATALIGDPSFKSQERPLLDPEALRHHQRCLHKQLTQLWADTATPCELLNNYDWLGQYPLLDFLRAVGKHSTVNTMLAKEALKRRLTSGISYTEFSYPLLQAYDFYHLYQHHGVRLQMGGSDQWGNITAGAALIRKKAGGQAFGLTTPLLTQADGTKFGKTEQGNIWLDPALTTPYQFYQFWHNTADEEALPLLKKLTLLPLEALEAHAQAHAQAPHERRLQQLLAREMTTWVHGAALCRQVADASQLLFGRGPIAALERLPAPLLLEVLAGVPHVTITQGTLAATQDVTDLVTVATQGAIFASKRAAREVITAGGLRINKVPITDPHQAPEFTWLHGRYLLVQRGKKAYYLLERV